MFELQIRDQERDEADLRDRKGNRCHAQLAHATVVPDRSQRPGNGLPDPLTQGRAGLSTEWQCWRGCAGFGIEHLCLTQHQCEHGTKRPQAGEREGPRQRRQQQRDQEPACANANRHAGLFDREEQTTARGRCMVRQDHRGCRIGQPVPHAQRDGGWHQQQPQTRQAGQCGQQQPEATCIQGPEIHAYGSGTLNTRAAEQPGKHGCAIGQSDEPANALCRQPERGGDHRRHDGRRGHAQRTHSLHRECDAERQSWPGTCSGHGARCGGLFIGRRAQRRDTGDRCGPLIG